MGLLINPKEFWPESPQDVRADTEVGSKYDC